MISLGKLAVALFAIAICVWAHGIAWAQTPLALVLETSGPRIPGVRPFTELLEGTTVSLPSTSKIIFLHYHTCRTVHVVGGLITFGTEGYTITGGTKESEERTPCPRSVTLKREGETTGVLLRGLGALVLNLSPRPNVVVVGALARNYATVRVLREGKLLLETPLDSQRVRWPIGAASLVVDTEYELTLIPRVAGAVPVTTRFRVAPLSVDPADEALTLIRVDE